MTGQAICSAAASTRSRRCAARAWMSARPGASLGMPRASAMNDAATQPQAPAATRLSPACSAATNAPQNALPQPAHRAHACKGGAYVCTAKQA